MKRVIKNYSTLVIALMVACTFSFVNTAAANDEKKDSNNNNIPGLTFKYIGTKDSQPVFLLNLVNADEEEFIVSFRDKNGTVLYSDRYKGANISQKFVINTNEIGTGELSVHIRAVGSNQVDLYKIGTTQNVVTDVVVNKIK